jgi:general secretion pathway protein I
MQSVETDGREKGFSLLETLVAIVILGVSLVVILQLYSEGLKAGDLSEQYTRALFIAQNKMEEILLQPMLEEGEISEEIEGDFSYHTTITWIEPEEDEKRAAFDLFDVTVRVTWQAGIAEKEVEISTVAIGERIVGEGGEG